jgi:hypothetical protein
MENLKAGIQFIRNRVDFQSHSKTFPFVRIAKMKAVVYSAFSDFYNKGLK